MTQEEQNNHYCTGCPRCRGNDLNCTYKGEEKKCVVSHLYGKDNNKELHFYCANCDEEMGYDEIRKCPYIPTLYTKEKCKCGSVQFSYAGDCLSCGLSKKERSILISTPHTEKEECKHEIVDYEPGHCFTCTKCGVCHGTKELFISPSDKTWRGKICEIISEMLDNPDTNGIYRTTRCYDKLERLLTSATIKAKERLLRKLNEVKNPFQSQNMGNEQINHANEWEQMRSMFIKAINLEEPKS